MRFGIIGVAGYVAPRHLRAIAALNGELAVAQDIADHARVLDKDFPRAAFFTDIDRLERHLAKEARKGNDLDYLSVCSPNHLHDEHIRLAFRNGADAICEKPVVINPWTLDLLQEEQMRHGQQVWTILQLRLLPSLVALRERVAAADPAQRFAVDLSYITERGGWYFASWKGDEKLSGGISTNIGIHFFDLLQWVFGPVGELRVHVRRPEVVAGTLVLQRADVRWFMSVDSTHLPVHVRSEGVKTFRSITVNGEELDFTTYDAEDLHTASYRRILAGDGFGLDDAAPSVRLTYAVRTTPISAPDGTAHPKVPEVLA
jgi:UDP-N-acetyl-2-amino-2-deoxyglucuronate dehydrogenase